MNCNFPFVCFHIVFSKFGFSQNLVLLFGKSLVLFDQFQLDLVKSFCLGDVLKLNFGEICDNFGIVSSVSFV